MWQSRAALYILQPVNYLRSPLPISVLVRIWILSSSLAGDENQPNSYILKKSKIMQLLERNVLPVQTLCCWTFPNSSLILMHSPHFGVYFLHCVLQEFCYIETLALLEACANWSWVKNLFFCGFKTPITGTLGSSVACREQGSCNVPLGGSEGVVRGETKPPGIENADLVKMSTTGNVFSFQVSLKRPQRIPQGFFSLTYLLHHQSWVYL